MATDRFMTLAIHTYPHALHLKMQLESHGLEVRLENIGSSSQPVEAGVRVKISSKDLPLALRVTESGDGIGAALTERRLSGLDNNVLVPVDFSEYSDLSVTIGFALAERLGLNVTLLHTFATPYFSDGFGNVAEFDAAQSEEVQEIEAASAMERESKLAMNRFRDKINDRIKAGDLPKIHFSTFVEEGLPEEVILEYSRVTPPAVIVMATRGRSRKEEELIGSVTAEVLDSCRVPVFAVPEHYTFTSIAEIKKLAFFCNMTQNDLLSVDTLMRMFSYPDVDITLVPVSSRLTRDSDGKLEMLKKYFSENYPTARFSVGNISPDASFRTEMERLVGERGIELLVVPNKKKNVFARLFNPGIAHKILFEKDIPILALPV